MQKFTISDDALIIHLFIQKNRGSRFYYQYLLFIVTKISISLFVRKYSEDAMCTN